MGWISCGCLGSVFFFYVLLVGGMDLYWGFWFVLVVCVLGVGLRCLFGCVLFMGFCGLGFGFFCLRCVRGVGWVVFYVFVFGFIQFWLWVFSFFGLGLFIVCVLCVFVGLVFFFFIVSCFYLGFCFLVVFVAFVCLCWVWLLLCGVVFFWVSVW